MNKYVYPAVFTKEDTGYSINFPDLESCYTCADNLEEGLEMAEDVLALILYGYEKDNRPIPSPSDPSSIQIEPSEFINYIKADTFEYRKMYCSKAIKKLLLYLNISTKKLSQEVLTSLRFCKKLYYNVYSRLYRAVLTSCSFIYPPRCNRF